jgi:hypothetical protein
MDKEYFLNGEWKTELGIIENIYVNVDMLYKLSINKDLADSDKKEKKEINLYDYVKNILSAVNSAIGNGVLLSSLYDIFIYIFNFTS